MSQADLLTTLRERVTAALRAAVGDVAADADPLLRFSDGRFGDIQSNAAMPLAKRAKQKSRDLAAAIVEQLEVADICTPPTAESIAGPGFINLTLRDDAITAALNAMHADARLGVPAAEPARRVVVDYCGANVAKQMHVGHLRSLILGDCFARVLAFLGHDVIRQNHVGDWGLQMGMITHAIEQAGIALDTLSLPQLETLYREINAAQKDNTTLRQALVEQTRQLQQTPKDDLHAWQRARALTLDAVHAVFAQLGVLLTPDDVRGESFYSDQFDALVQALQQGGLAVETEGAIGIFTPELARPGKDADGNKVMLEPPPFRIVSRDGTYQYATFDLAAVRYRVQQLHADWLVYTHDARQAEHFAQLFAVARKAGYAPDTVRLDFAPFGTVLGDDHKPLKTRDGDNVKLADLLTEADERALAIVRDKSPDLPDADATTIAHAVGVGALKYADLSSERVREYVFDWDRMLAFKGNTAPYLQNATTRIASIFRKAGLDPATAALQVTQLDEPAERALAIQLLQFAEAVRQVAEHLEPHRLCTYLYELATAFHTFYEQCPILSAEPATRDNRLALAAVTQRTLSTGLGLLGITPLERM